MSIRIRGVWFEWIQFPDLEGLTDLERLAQEEIPDDRFGRFDCVHNRFGVLLFINWPQRVQYVGMSGENPDQTGDLKFRIRQFFNRGGANNFWDNWTRECHQGDFRRYIENLQLITLSTDETNNDQVPVILAEIKRVFICEFYPIYNRSIPAPPDLAERLTDAEQDRLRGCIFCRRLNLLA